MIHLSLIIYQIQIFCIYWLKHYPTIFSIWIKPTFYQKTWLTITNRFVSHTNFWWSSTLSYIIFFIFFRHFYILFLSFIFWDFYLTFFFILFCFSGTLFYLISFYLFLLTSFVIYHFIQSYSNIPDSLTFLFFFFRIKKTKRSNKRHWSRSRQYW